MPGRLIMETHNSGADAESLGAASTEAHTKQNHESNSGGAVHQMNGNATPTTSAQQAEHSLTSATLKRTAGSTYGPGSPPQLDQSWRQSDANKSFGLLLGRLSQQCVSDLSDVLGKMSEMPAAAEPAHVNGVTANIIDKSETSLKKKRAMMDFAKDQRDRFTKALVLSDWCRNEEDMAKLVDLKVWQEKWTADQNTAIYSIGQTKHELSRSGFKIAAPNLEGAMEYLATGKSQLPDLGYLPLKKLTAKELLRTLKDMNVILTTRLVLHEELPPFFNQYEVRNGRATFRVPGEFEVDLAVASEDETSQFFFIDLRYLFSPAPARLPDEIRPEIEARVNDALLTKGLQGCYDCLHNWILTQKIIVMGEQAKELSRSKWVDCLFLEQKRRVLVVQYWQTLSGQGKSWLEIGTQSGRNISSSVSTPVTPSVCVKWVRRNGTEVTSEIVEADTVTLDIEGILQTVIAKHISQRLSNIRDQLSTIGGPTSKLELSLQTSDTEPDACSLKLELPNMREPFEIGIQQILGHLNIRPSTLVAGRMEQHLIANPTENLPRAIAHLACQAVQERFAKAAEVAGWRPCRLSPQPYLRNLLPQHLTRDVYTCNQSWSKGWALIVTFSLAGEQWSIARLEDKIDERSGNVGQIVAQVTKLDVDHVLEDVRPASRRMMRLIEDLATGVVSFMALGKELAQIGVSHEVEEMVTRRRGATRIVRKALTFYYSQAQSASSSSLDFGLSRVLYLGVASEGFGLKSGDVNFEVRIKLKRARLGPLRKYLSEHPDEMDVAVSRDAVLAFHITTSFGQPFLNTILARFQTLRRLNLQLAALAEEKMKCVVASPNNFTFTYSSVPEWSMSITRPNGLDADASVAFAPVESNSQTRLKHDAETLINGRTKASDGFLVLVKVLTMGMPLAVMLDKISTLHRKQRTLDVEPYQLLQYSLNYKQPMPEVTVRILLRGREDRSTTGLTRRLVWHLSVGAQTNSPDAMTDDLKTAIMELFGGKGEGWQGLHKGGIMAMASGVADAVEKLDAIIRRFEGQAKAPIKNEDKDNKNDTAIVKPDPTTSTTANPPAKSKPTAPTSQPPAPPAPMMKQSSSQSSTPRNAATVVSAAAASARQHAAALLQHQQQQQAQQRPPSAAQMQRAVSNQHPMQQRPAPAQMQRAASNSQHAQQQQALQAQLQRQQQQHQQLGQAQGQGQAGRAKHEVIELD